MRWKWRLGLLFIGGIELALLLWGSSTLAAPPEILLYTGGIVAVVLTTMLLVRPFLFTLVILWLGGAVGSAWYFLRFLPPTAALGLGATVSTVASAIGVPFVSRALGFVLRHRLWTRH